MNASEVYLELETDLRRFARSIARHEQEADDLIQQAVMKSLAHEDLLKGLPVYKQRAWFFRVMKNQLVDDRRKEQRLTGWEEDYDQFKLDQRFTHIEVTELLSNLSQEYRDIVFKRYWIGLSSQEIGQQLHLPAATVRYKLSQALKQLKKKLEEA
ncbi:RNA polymerase sigma factor [Jeotgalibacillus terrae]|uniref:RNA polymerase sigma factor n=1 Tax=Jeotgalibacillus terrae TaxID=587735 RepID=A0ABW5ZPB8_9BACL|nr:RNA polymerase sigma factor [Jeotgalibacillus terrae]MBM7578202.1 RNA polymerase sigma-70 factor (ECF subfamily) [Jeotgalibacillus terrae]